MRWESFAIGSLSHRELAQFCLNSLQQAIADGQFDRGGKDLTDLMELQRRVVDRSRDQQELERLERRVKELKEKLGQ